MAPVGITARFPLGVYHGHLPDGSPDALPSPARLFSALVSAAHTGSVADSEGDLSSEIADALTWLEEHPPNGIRVPSHVPVSDTSIRVAYRDRGTIEQSKLKLMPKVISDGTAVDDPIGWCWDEMPDIVRDALLRLIEDVPCLGEADSPVVIEIGDVEPNWRLDVRASAFTPGGARVPVAGIGRRAVLEEAYMQACPSKTPTRGQDKYKKSESVVTFSVTDEGEEAVRYVPVCLAPSAAPWQDVYVFPVDDGTGRALSPARRVEWCVAFHRALVGRIGDGAPPVVTGRYPDGVAVPANRIAIQYLPAPVLAQSVVGDLGTPGAFVVMLPSNLPWSETEAVREGLASLLFVRSRWATPPLRMHEEIFKASAFWTPPTPGISRLWSPIPAAVPEVVKQRGQWTFEDAILLSLGFVWRDSLESVEVKARRYRGLVEQVRARGASVIWHRRLVKEPGAYAHKMPRGVVAQPYIAQINMGDLSDDRTLIVLGQSRHLGGGLLVPVDVPAELAEAALRRPR